MKFRPGIFQILMVKAVFAFTALCLLSSCDPWYDESDSWNGPRDTDTLSAESLSMLAYRKGDVIRMKRYHRSTDSGNYIYQGREEYRVIDSFIQPRQEDRNSYSYDRELYRKYLVLKIEGPGDLRCELMPFEGENYLKLIYSNLEYPLEYKDFNSQSELYQGTMNIGGREYKDVYAFKSYPGSGYRYWGYPNPKNYIDSSYAFYNREHGLLKLIYNNSLILVRDPD